MICSWHLQFSLRCAAFLYAGNALCSRHLRVCAWREHIYTLHSIFPSCTFLLLLATLTIIADHPESWQALSSKLQSNWLTFNLGSKGLLLWYHLFYFKMNLPLKTKQGVVYISQTVFDTSFVTLCMCKEASLTSAELCKPLNASCS